MNPNIVEIQNESSIVQAGNIKLAEGLRPTRVVLRSLERKFVTHLEFLHIHSEERTREGREYTYVVAVHNGFDNGHYFDYDEKAESKVKALEEARADFNERVRRGY